MVYNYQNVPEEIYIAIKESHLKGTFQTPLLKVVMLTKMQVISGKQINRGNNYSPKKAFNKTIYYNEVATMELNTSLS